MQQGRPSATAFGAAGHRAAHQTLEGGAIFADPFARILLGVEGCARADARAGDPQTRALRLFVAARSRFAEDALTRAVARGVRQCVVLGAGYDTFGLRNPHEAAGLKVFEVDHPATQAWKRRRLQEAGLSTPPSLSFIPVDFETQDLRERLAAGGVDADARAFFAWLGVAPYLQREAALRTLAVIAATRGAEVVFDYAEPLENFAPESRAGAQALAARVAERGEPLQSFFDPAELESALFDLGFSEVEDIDLATLLARYGVDLSDNPRGGAHVARALA